MNIINFITFLVIVIGSAALFVVLSAFAGLKTFSLSFSNSFDPDLKASPTVGKHFTLSPEQEEALQKIPGLAQYAKELEERAYLTVKFVSMFSESRIIATTNLPTKRRGGISTSKR